MQIQIISSEQNFLSIFCYVGRAVLLLHATGTWDGGCNTYLTSKLGMDPLNEHIPIVFCDRGFKDP